MRSSNEIIEEIRSIEAVIQEGVRTQELIPDDFTLQISLDQDREYHSGLVDELRRAMIRERKHYLQYIIENASANKPIPLRRLTGSLSSIQDLLDRVSRMYFKQKESMMQLNWVTTFAGSFGTLLALNLSDREFFSRTYYSFETLFAVFEGLNDDSLLYELMHDQLQDPTLLAAVLRFLHVQTVSNNAVRVTWGDVEGQTKEVRFTSDRIHYLYGSLKDFQPMPEQLVSRAGIIKGISLLRRKIEFVEDTTQVVTTAQADSEVLQVAKNLIDLPVMVNFLLRRKLNVISERTEESWTVIQVSKRT